MLRTRMSGILLHVTSLPSPHGIGDLGAEAHRFVESLAQAGQGVWQVLPLGPTGYGDSPYQCFSAFAGNPLLIDLRELAQRGWLDEQGLAEGKSFPEDYVDYQRVNPWRLAQLRRAFAGFQQRGTADDVAQWESFRDENRYWLADHCLFMSLKENFGGAAWTQWPPEVVQRKPTVLAEWEARLAENIRFHAFVQWSFSRQWRSLKQFAHQHGVGIVGDVPIFAAHDSADVWAHPALFQLDERGLPRVVAGVPPDYFSATGQLWGNPLYDWRQMAAEGFDWWIRRLKQAITLFDAVRLDHFRGFEAYWEIPAGATTAAPGRWVLGPGETFFTAATQALGELPLIAEDLGVITPPVEALRDRFGYPGMRVLQFAFGDDVKASDYRPHHYVPHCVVYTGTHDNDTTVGWFHSRAGEGTTRSAEQISREQEHTLRYVGTSGREIHWDLIRLAIASVADTAIFPMQDVLGLGSEARMNMPSTTSGNWRWRLLPGQFTSEHEQRLKHLARTFDRQMFLRRER